MLFGEGRFFTTGAYPLHEVIDPTGAGDSFAGGLAGHLASLGKDELHFDDIAASLVYGTVMASYNCESFSMEKLASLAKGDISSRFEEFRGYTAF
jgi:sugar/nucleoside kinase (ribokinase family)